jgi:hypothetical protein
MKKLRRSALVMMFAMVAASIISVSTVSADEEPPGGNPNCGTVPTAVPECWESGQPGCKTIAACNGPQSGAFGYCCQENDPEVDPVQKCREYTGRWTCCNGQWVKKCTVSSWSLGGTCHSNNRCSL